MIDVLFVDEQVILVTTDLMPSATAVMNLVTLHRTASTWFLPQEHYATKTDLTEGINIPIPKGTDHTPLIMVPDMEDISAGHIHFTAIPTVTEAAVTEGRPRTPHPAATAAHATLWLLDTPITTCAITPTGIVSPHPTFAISPPDIICTTPQTGAGLAPATATTLHRKHSHAMSKTFSPHKPHHSKTVNIQDSSSDSSSNSDSNSDPLNY